MNHVNIWRKTTPEKRKRGAKALRPGMFKEQLAGQYGWTRKAHVGDEVTEIKDQPVRAWFVGRCNGFGLSTLSAVSSFN